MRAVNRAMSRPPFARLHRHLLHAGAADFQVKRAMAHGLWRAAARRYRPRQHDRGGRGEDCTLDVFAMRVAVRARRHSRRAPTRSSINGKIVTLDARRHASRRSRSRDGKIVAVGKSDDIRKLAGPSTRTVDLSGRTVDPRPDRLAHARDPRRAVLCDRSELDRRQVDPRGDGAHRREGEEREARRMDHRGGRLDAAAVRREAPPDAGRARRRRAGQSGLHPAVLFRRAAHARGLCGAQHHQRRRRAAARQARARRGRQARPAGSRATTRPSPACSTSCRCRASSRASKARKQFFRELNRLGLDRRERSGRLQSHRRKLSAAVQGLAGPRAHRARHLFAVRAAARQGAGRHPGDDPDAADGLRRRLAALQRHRRERHLGHVQQRHADRGAEGAILRARQMGGVARHDADAALEQQQVGVASARRDRAGEQARSRSRSCAGRSRTSTTPRRRASRA